MASYEASVADLVATVDEETVDAAELDWGIVLMTDSFCLQTNDDAEKHSENSKANRMESTAEKRWTCPSS